MIILPTVLLIIGIVVYRRWRAFAILRIRDGRLEIRKGSLTAGQQRDLEEAARLSGVEKGRVRIVARGEGMTASTRPRNSGFEQRVRNIVRLWRSG